MSNQAMTSQQDAADKALKSAIKHNTLEYEHIADAIKNDLLDFFDLDTTTACLELFQAEKTKHKSRDIKRPWTGDKTITRTERQKRHVNVTLIRELHDELKKAANDGCPDLNDPDTFPAGGVGANKTKLSDEELQQGPSAKRAKGPAEDVEIAPAVPEGTAEDVEMAPAVLAGTAEDVEMAPAVLAGTAEDVEIAPAVLAGTAEDVEIAPAVPEGTAEEIAPAVPEGTAEDIAPAVAEGTAEEIAPAVPEGTAEEIAPAVLAGTAEEIAPAVPEGTAEEIAPAVPEGTAEDVEIAPAVLAGTAEEIAPAVAEGTAEEIAPAVAEGTAEETNTTNKGSRKGGGNRISRKRGNAALVIALDPTRSPNTGPNKKAHVKKMDNLFTEALKRQNAEHKKKEEAREKARQENNAKREADILLQKHEDDRKAYKLGLHRFEQSLMSHYFVTTGRVDACDPSEASTIALAKLRNVLGKKCLLEANGTITQIEAELKKKVYNKSDIAIFSEFLGEIDAKKHNCNVFSTYREFIELMQSATDEEYTNAAAYIADITGASSSSKGSYGPGVAKLVCSTIIPELVRLSKEYLSKVLQGSDDDTPFVLARATKASCKASIDCMKSEIRSLEIQHARDEAEMQRGAPPGTTNGSENALPATGAPEQPKVLVPAKLKGKEKKSTDTIVRDCWMNPDGSWSSLNASKKFFSIELFAMTSLRALILNTDFAKAMFIEIADLANANPNPMLRQGQKTFERLKGEAAARKTCPGDMLKQLVFWFTDIKWMISLALFCQGIMKSMGRAGLKNVPKSSETLLEAADAKYKALTTKVKAETKVQADQLARLEEMFAEFENPKQFFETRYGTFGDGEWREHAGDMQFSEEQQATLQSMHEKYSLAANKIKELRPGKSAAFKKLTDLKKKENEAKAASHSQVTVRIDLPVISWMKHLLHPFTNGSVEGFMDTIKKERIERQSLLATPELRIACGDVADSALQFITAMVELKPIMEESVICDTVRDTILQSQMNMEEFDKVVLLLYGSLQKCIEDADCSEVDMQAAFDAFVTGFSKQNEAMLYDIVHMDGMLGVEDCAVAKTHLSGVKTTVLDLGNKLGVKISDNLNVILENDVELHRESVAQLLTAEHAQPEMSSAPGEATKETMEDVDAGKTEDVDADKTEDVDAGKTGGVDAPLV